MKREEEASVVIFSIFSSFFSSFVPTGTLSREQTQAAEAVLRARSADDESKTEIADLFYFILFFFCCEFRLDLAPILVARQRGAINPNMPASQQLDRKTHNGCGSPLTLRS